MQDQNPAKLTVYYGCNLTISMYMFRQMCWFVVWAFTPCILLASLCHPRVESSHCCWACVVAYATRTMLWV